MAGQRLRSDERVAQYRVKAAEARKRAMAAHTPKVRDTFLAAAEAYERLASTLEDLKELHLPKH